MKKLVSVLSAPLALSFISTAFACAPEFDHSYLGADIGMMKNKRNTKDAERIHNDSVVLAQKRVLMKFIEQNEDLLPVTAPLHQGLSTHDAERADYAKALKERMPELTPEAREKMISSYMQCADNMRRGMKCDFSRIPDAMAEFRLYLEGADEIYRLAPVQTPEAWKKLLSLAPEQRKYRTVWVHFGLGSIFKDSMSEHFNNCRLAAREGFADTCGLVLRTCVVSCRQSKDPVVRIHNAILAERAGVQLFREISWGNPWSGYNFDKLDDVQYAKLTSDPLCREIMAIFGNSDKFRKTVLADGKKLRNADICAYFSYRAFRIDEAEKFLTLVEKDTLISCWVAAKVARYKDNIPGAARHLHRYLELLTKLTPQEMKEQPFGFTDNRKGDEFTSEIYALLGTTRVLRRDFAEAAQLFVQARNTEDLAIIIERFFTLSEMKNFITHCNWGVGVDGEYMRKIIYIAGRRAFRDGDYITAMEYLPRQEIHYVRNFVELMRIGADTSTPDDVRAFSYYQAAKILRYRGMELAGTHGKPDYFPGGFGYTTPCEECYYDRHTGVWQLCRNCRTYGRSHYVWGFNSTPDFNRETRRFHYRFKAAELALKAGNIAASQQLKALCNIFGGKCLGYQEADVFYKRLVNDSPDTQLGKIADKLRWFPVIPALEKEITSIDGCSNVADAIRLIDDVKPETQKK